MEAIALWQQALQTASDSRQQSLSLSYLALAYQQLGQWTQAEAAIAQSLERLGNDNDPITAAVRAQVLNRQGNLQLSLGRPEAALSSWEQAEQVYQSVGDSVGQLGSQINQAQALQTLGMYRRAQRLLQDLDNRLQDQPDSLLKALGLRSLGTVLQLTGNLEESRRLLQQSLAMTQQLDLPQESSITQFSLANTLRGLGKRTAALQLYQQGAIAAPPVIRLRSQLNQLSLLIELQRWSEAQDLLTQLLPPFDRLPPSRETIYARVNLAAHAVQIATQGRRTLPLAAIAQQLAAAAQQARDLQDLRAESYAVGQLAHLYEQTRQWDSAQDLTQRALWLAQSANAADVAYRWQWQLGRILKRDVLEERNRVEAIATYTAALETLQSIRRDLLATNPEFQFSFRKDVEPLYRELVELLVQNNPEPTELEQARRTIEALRESPMGVVHPTVRDLEQARRTIEALRVAELENFFRSACVESVEQVDFIDQNAAVFYPILLNQKLVVIVSLPGQPLRFHTVAVSLAEVETLVRQLRRTLILPYTSPQDYQPLARRLYGWLVQPVEQAIADGNIQTLIFVQDGILNNIPMSVLYDGDRYLVEKYNIARTPGLRLFEPKPLAQINLKAVIAGLSEPRHNFESLEFVQLELDRIRSEIPSDVLLDQEFTSTTLADRLAASSAPIVHIATHGQFSSESNETFILAWDQPITVNRFSRFLQSRQYQPNALELLVLSACETAAGDERAVLGLAGVAVQSGARSTLASLWLIDDASTSLLMTEFYRELKNGRSKTEALRNAQRSLLQGPYSHPRFWAAFVLLGNWQ